VGDFQIEKEKNNLQQDKGGKTRHGREIAAEQINNQWKKEEEEPGGGKGCLVETTSTQFKEKERSVSKAGYTNERGGRGNV